MPTNGRAMPSQSIGIQLPATDGFGTGCPDLKAAARAAEQASFDSVWVGDHFSFHVPVVESIVAASIAAAVTDRVKIGFGVLLPAMRHPGWLAKQLSSLQALSGGRLLLGIGIGGEFPEEWQAVGVPLRERAERTDAFLAAVPSLLRGTTTYLGQPWNVAIPPLLPTGELPPLWVGGRSDAALRRAVRFGAGWLGVWLDEDGIRARVDRLRTLATDRGTLPPPIGHSVMLHVNDDEALAHREMATYMETIYRLPYERLRPYTIAGDEDTVVTRLEALLAAGVDHLVLLPTGRTPTQTIEQLAVVAGRLRPDPVAPR